MEDYISSKVTQSYCIRITNGQNTFIVNGMNYFTLPLSQVKIVKTKIRSQTKKAHITQ